MCPNLTVISGNDIEIKDKLALGNRYLPAHDNLISKSYIFKIINPWCYMAVKPEHLQKTHVICNICNSHGKDKY